MKTFTMTRRSALGAIAVATMGSVVMATEAQQRSRLGVVAFNCAVPAFVLKKGQLEEDIGPRLVAMVRNIEAALGMH